MAEDMVDGRVGTWISKALKWQTERRHAVTRWMAVLLLFAACFQAWEEQHSAAEACRTIMAAQRLEALANSTTDATIPATNSR